MVFAPDFFNHSGARAIHDPSGQRVDLLSMVIQGTKRRDSTLEKCDVVRLP
jgi:hypothetical protein